MRKGKDRSVVGDGSNLAYIWHLLRFGPEVIQKAISRCPIALARAEYTSFLNNTSDKFRLGVTSGVIARLTPWLDPQIAAITEVTDFNRDALAGELFSFYFATAINKPEHSVVAAFTLNCLLDHLFDDQVQLDHPLTMLMDEFTNYGNIPHIQRKLAVVRNAQVGMVLGMQDIHQLFTVYSNYEAASILKKARTRVFFRPSDLDAEKISRALGKKTIEKRDYISNLVKREFVQELMSAGEVLNMDEDKMLVFTPGTRPVKASRINPGAYNGKLGEAVPDRDEIRVSEAIYSMSAEGARETEYEKEGKKQRNKYAKLPKDKKVRRGGDEWGCGEV